MTAVAGSERIAAVDAYIAKSQPFARPILEYLRDLMHEGAPGTQEAIKWSMPFFLYGGIILGNMAAFKQHCSLGLWGTETSAAMQKDGVGEGGSMGSFGRITDLKDLLPRKQLLKYVKDAAKRIDEGSRTRSLAPRPKVSKPPAEVPEALAAALKKNKKAGAQFEKMSPSCQREYCDWISSARREETRGKRLAQAIEWIAEGKDRNWKYQNC